MTAVFKDSAGIRLNHVESEGGMIWLPIKRNSSSKKKTDCEEVIFGIILHYFFSESSPVEWTLQLQDAVRSDCVDYRSFLEALQAALSGFDQRFLSSYINVLGVLGVSRRMKSEWCEHDPYDPKSHYLEFTYLLYCPTSSYIQDQDISWYIRIQSKFCYDRSLLRPGKTVQHACSTISWARRGPSTQRSVMSKSQQVRLMLDGKDEHKTLVLHFFWILPVLFQRIRGLCFLATAFTLTFESTNNQWSHPVPIRSQCARPAPLPWNCRVMAVYHWEPRRSSVKGGCCCRVFFFSGR